MIKTNHNSPNKDKGTKTVSGKGKFYDEYYYDVFSLKQHPVSEIYLRRIAIEWVEWVLDEKNDCLTMEEFLIHKGMNENTMSRWRKRCAELEEAATFVKMFLASKRDKGASQRKYDSAWMKFTHAQYSKQIQAIEEWRAKIHSKEVDVGGVKYIVVPDLASVPKASTDED